MVHQSERPPVKPLIGGVDIRVCIRMDNILNLSIYLYLSTSIHDSFVFCLSLSIFYNPYPPLNYKVHPIDLFQRDVLL